MVEIVNTTTRYEAATVRALNPKSMPWKLCRLGIVVWVLPFVSLDQTKVSGSRQCEGGRPAGHGVRQAPKSNGQKFAWEKKEVLFYLVLLSH